MAAGTSPLLDVIARSVSWPISMVLFVPIRILPFTIGVWAARRRLLEEPERRLRFLRRVVPAGVPLAVPGAVPHMLVVTHAWAPGLALAFGAKWLHVMSGYAGGVGYAALIALVAVVIAALMARFGVRGPAETFLRRMTYGRPGSGAAGHRARSRPPPPLEALLARGPERGCGPPESDAIMEA